MLCIRHQQVGIVDDKQAAFQLFNCLLGQVAYPLVVFRGIDFLDAGMGNDPVSQEHLMDQTDDKGLTCAAVAEHQHIHLRTLTQTTLTLRGHIERNQALHLGQNLLFTDGLCKERIDIVLGLGGTHRFGSSRRCYGSCCLFGLAGTAIGAELGIVSQFTLALNTSLHILSFIVVLLYL